MKITGYLVKISPFRSCMPSKSHQNAFFFEGEYVQASNYFDTLKERYQAYSISKPGEHVIQADGPEYFITLTTEIK